MDLPGYLSLRDLAAYTRQSIRSLRNRLTDPVHPLPHFKVGGKIFVKKEEYDEWITQYRVKGDDRVSELVEEVMAGL